MHLARHVFGLRGGAECREGAPGDFAKTNGEGEPHAGCTREQSASRQRAPVQNRGGSEFRPGESIHHDINLHRSGEQWRDRFKQQARPLTDDPTKIGTQRPTSGRFTRHLRCRRQQAATTVWRAHDPSSCATRGRPCAMVHARDGANTVWTVYRALTVAAGNTPTPWRRPHAMARTPWRAHRLDGARRARARHQCQATAARGGSAQRSRRAPQQRLRYVWGTVLLRRDASADTWPRNPPHRNLVSSHERLARSRSPMPFPPPPSRSRGSGARSPREALRRGSSLPVQSTPRSRPTPTTHTTVPQHAAPPFVALRPAPADMEIESKPAHPRVACKLSFTGYPSDPSRLARRGEKRSQSSRSRPKPPR